MRYQGGSRDKASRLIIAVCFRAAAHLCCKVKDSVNFLRAEKVRQQVAALEVPFRELQAAKTPQLCLGDISASERQ